jgi:presenilin-like A22 family membrane protease
VKHNWKITLLLLSMFLLTQFIGLYVINSDPFHIKVVEANGTVATVPNPDLSWIEPPTVTQESDFTAYLGSVIFAFIIAIFILFLLTKFKIDIILRVWFFVVVAIALFITFNAIFPKQILLNSLYFTIPAALAALTLSFIKIFRKNFFVHNFTELLIYPGIATIFVPILNVWSVIVLLVIISIYDIWAVWHSGIMQKMAKYQINKLKVFSGFFVPYISRKVRKQLRKMKKSKLKKKKVRVNIAILGGGDVIFPIITAGVMLRVLGLMSAIFIVMGATLGLALLLIFSEKKKFYPAMPFITAGIAVGIILSYLLL